MKIGHFNWVLSSGDLPQEVPVKQHWKRSLHNFIRSLQSEARPLVLLVRNVLLHIFNQAFVRFAGIPVTLLKSRNSNWKKKKGIVSTSIVICFYVFFLIIFLVVGGRVEGGGRDLMSLGVEHDSFASGAIPWGCKYCYAITSSTYVFMFKESIVT